MKKILTPVLLSFWFLLPLFIFAQNEQITECFPDAYKSFKNSSPKLLPTNVQNAYDVKWYFLNLNAENNTVALSGDVTIKAQVVWNKMDTFSFHLHENYVIEKVLINGVEKTVIDNGHERLITDLNMPKNTVFDAQIFYHGNAGGSGSFFSGISNKRDTRWGGFDVTWTLSEPNNAYEWFPVKQNLTDKADSSWVFVTTTKPNKVASNGKLTKTVDLPDNKVRYEWKSSYPIDYYLISIAVAEYQDYSIYATLPQTGEQLLIQNYIYNSPECLTENKPVIDKTAEMITHYSTIFGKYPFSREKYGHALAPMGGAMEHQTMTTTGGFAGWEGTTAHELVHQWFGDNVTCASWQHIWLNEGFARYGEYLWWEHLYGKEYTFNMFKQNIIGSVIQSGKTGSVCVPIEEIDNESRIFHTTYTYNKGGCLVHMLRYELGDELFFNVLKTYQNRFKDNVATTEDLQNVIEELLGKDFSTFFAQWFYGAGYPGFDIKWCQTNDKLILNSEQRSSAHSTTPLFKVTYEIGITYSDDSTEVVPFYHDETNKQFSYTIPDNKTIKSLEFDPNNWLLAKCTFVKVNGIEDISREDLITVYPNPTTGELRMENGEWRMENVEIFDVYGKKVSSHHLIPTSSHHLINISDFQAGIYFIKITTEKGVVNKKIIKY